MNYAVTVFTPVQLCALLGSELDNPVVRASLNIAHACIHAVEISRGTHLCSLCDSPLRHSGDIHSIATVVPVLGLDKGQVGAGMALCLHCTGLPWPEKRDRLLVVVEQLSGLPTREIYVHPAGHA
jgi:hypothetical protein